MFIGVRVIVVPELVIGDLVIAIAYVFRNVNIIILIFTAIGFVVFFAGFLELVLGFLVLLFMPFFRFFQGGVFFHLFLDALFQQGRRYLQ